MSPDGRDCGAGPGRADAGANGCLSELEQAVLDFADLRWRYAGAKEGAIRERFDWSSTRYYQVLGSLMDRPEAAAYAPVLVARLRRLRDAWRPQRSAEGRDLRDVL